MDETLRSAAGPTFTLLRLVTGASRKVQTAWQSVEGPIVLDNQNARARRSNCSHALTK
jgi:hypothetical protein